MKLSEEDCAKRRLVDREEIRLAVRLLKQHGYGDEEIAPQLSRFYYVDIDTLNEELAVELDRHLVAVAGQELRKVA
ncbi:hypothetical protein GRZ55_15140 [Chelativorans sp. ZYF759]|uniref:hypothetical protein n=1 Tax=Chelativorans sp. ZYF759 TaxID=2692213 RepID=UPI00145F4D10|nr:hypothetical protein [Chelativorans sp. ZYF759]NMG40580.1 hypothetical protein [Chelativorans sp. ZYF759]